MTKRARLIVNPVSRTLPSRDRLATAPAWLRLHDWQVDTHCTEAPRHATALARQAAEEGYAAVIAAGGGDIAAAPCALDRRVCCCRE